MVLKADQERLKALLSETVLLLCKNGLEFKSDFCIEALIGITVDQDDVFLISIKETVENELRAAQRAKEEAEKLALEAAQSPAPESPSRTHRKRKRKSPRPQSPSQDKNIKLETSGDRELDNNTSNTSFQDYNDESQHSRNMKFESGGAGDMGGDDEDNSNEIVFVKTENTDDQSLYGGPGQSSFLDSPYQSGMDSSQMSSSFQSPGAHSSHPGTSSWQSPMDSSQQGMSQNPLETQQMRGLHAAQLRHHASIGALLPRIHAAAINMPSSPISHSKGTDFLKPLRSTSPSSTTIIHHSKSIVIAPISPRNTPLSPTNTRGSLSPRGLTTTSPHSPIATQIRARTPPRRRKSSPRFTGPNAAQLAEKVAKNEEKIEKEVATLVKKIYEKSAELTHKTPKPEIKQ